MSSSRPPKNLPKKVNPPHVPIPLDNLNHSFRHSGSSFSSAGYVSAEDSVANLDGTAGSTTFSQLLPPPDTPGSTMGSLRDDQSDYGSTVSKSPGSINYMVTSNAFTFPVPRGETLTHKAAVFYHQQLALQEDQVCVGQTIRSNISITKFSQFQGIDLQSPLQGRDSPGSNSAGSGSRHSTASLDSGKASSYLTSSSNRGGSSIGSGSVGVSGTSPRCSVSSCSISVRQCTILEKLVANSIDCLKPTGTRRHLRLADGAAFRRVRSIVFTGRL
jgi:CASK-interacting protein